MNKKLKFAYGYVLALAALMFICYVAFMGDVYLTGGDMTKAAAITAVLAAALALGCVYLQRVKGTADHFKRNIMIERALLPCFVAGCLVAFVPFAHFWTVRAHEEQIVSLFQESVTAAKNMFDEYDDYARHRIDDYRYSLNRSLRSGRQTAAGFKANTLGKVSGGDTIMRNNMVKSLQLQLQPVGNDSVRNEALLWLSKAGEGNTVWNVFLLGNVKTIDQAVTAWHQSMQEAADLRLSNEPKAAADTVGGYAGNQYLIAKEKLAQVGALYQKMRFPRPVAWLLGLVCFALLFLPYLLQERHTKSREKLPWWNGQHTPSDTDHDYDSIHHIVLYNEVSIPKGKATPQHASRYDMLRDQLGQADQPYQLIQTMMEQQTLTTEDLLQLLHLDCNLLDAATVKQCIDDGLFTTDQLIEANEFVDGFVDMLGTPMRDVLPADKHIETLDGVSTEFYFWGIPSSGKTCAIGVVINAAQEGTVADSVRVLGDCQGYDYLSELMSIFTGNRECCILPGRTPVDANFAMRLNMTDYKGKVHPVTLIDMAGELFCYLYWREHNLTQYFTRQHERAFESFSNILVGNRTNSRKFHFFIIEYGAEKKKYKGQTQDEYLTCGLRYLEQSGVLSDATDGICVIVTKYDHVFTRIQEDEDINNHLSDFLYRNYGGFLTLLRQYCRKYEIAGGFMPDPVPFTIGEVCFKNYCRISTEYAKDIVKIILRESKGFSKGRLASIEEKLRQ